MPSRKYTGIYCKSFNFVILSTLTKIKASAHFWIHLSSMYVVVDVMFTDHRYFF